jgi:hypothetical protein
MKEIIQKLSVDLPKSAVQRTSGNETKKGYDTTGYGYQYCVDRFNEVLGNEWGFSWKELFHREGQFKGGRPFHEITVEVSVWIGSKENERFCVGGHLATLHCDALKGAITNGLKKTAAFWGVGRAAFAGTIDDDNKPLPDSMDNLNHARSKTINKEESKTINKEEPVIKEVDEEKQQALKLLNKVGIKCYGDHWPKKLTELVMYSSKGITGDAETLSREEIEKFIAGIDQKMKDINETKQTIKKKDLITDGQLKTLNMIGKKVHGDTWDEEREKLVIDITEFRTTSSKELTRDEASKIIEKLEKETDPDWMKD